MITIQCCAGCKWYKGYRRSNNGECTKVRDRYHYEAKVTEDDYCEDYEDEEA